MDAQKLIDLLDEDLSYELQAIENYLFQFATAGGLRGHEFREIMADEMTDELGHAKFLADKIVALGGTPTCEAASWDKKTDLRDMIAYDMELEREAIARYQERAEQARAFGDVGLSVQLEDMVRDETTHKETLERLLRGSLDL